MEPDGNHAQLMRYLATHDAKCPDCGYRLRGLTGFVCPECGTLLSVQRIREQLFRGPGLRAHRVIAAALTPLALVGFAAAIADGASAWGRTPRTPATTVTGMGLCLLPVLLHLRWARAEHDVINGPAATGWFHGSLAVALAIAGIIFGWRLVH